MARIKIPQQGEEKLPFTFNVKPIDEENIKKSWEKILSIISDHTATEINKVIEGGNKKSDKLQKEI